MSTTSATQSEHAVLEPFSRSAKYYDQFYADKDYARLADLHLSRLRDYPADNISHIIEIGAGTGRFTEALDRFAPIIAVEPSTAMLQAGLARFTAAGALIFNHGFAEFADYWAKHFYGDATVIFPFSSICFVTVHDPDYSRFFGAMSAIQHDMSQTIGFSFDAFEKENVASDRLRTGPRVECINVESGGIPMLVVERVTTRRYDPNTGLLHVEMRYHEQPTDGLMSQPQDSWVENYTLRPVDRERFLAAATRAGYRLCAHLDAESGESYHPGAAWYTLETWLRNR